MTVCVNGVNMAAAANDAYEMAYVSYLISENRRQLGESVSGGYVGGSWQRKRQHNNGEG